jgi:tRNA uridine 5-carbamoylmethylation protein Kti12
MNKPLLIAMMGLPRSGKSTIVAKLSKVLAAPIVRRDAIRLALHGERFLSEAEPMVKAMSVYMIRSLFIAGHEIVICDETNYSRAARDAVKDQDWNTVFYEVGTPSDVCKARAIATNQPDLVGVIEEMASRYEPLGPDEKRVDDTFVQDKNVIFTPFTHVG